MVVFLVVVIGCVSIAAVLTTMGGAAPKDWDPTDSCRAHRGIEQVIGDTYTSAAVCGDGTYRSNPYD